MYVCMYGFDSLIQVSIRILAGMAIRIFTQANSIF